MAKKNPVQEYKRESFEMFTELLDTINIEIVKALSSVNLEQVAPQQKDVIEESESQGSPKVRLTSAPPGRSSSGQQPKRNLKVGRNDPCPCGSGKKYKVCHG
jgi:preprotein translocase subunit SecA